jgi:hypothetical protein
MLGRREFDGSAAVAIFRIVQAGLSKGGRHGHASRALIAWMKRKNGLILTVTDHRKGISRKLIYGHDSLGIAGIGESAVPLGGTFTLGGRRQRDNIGSTDSAVPGPYGGRHWSLTQHSVVVIRDQTTEARPAQMSGPDIRANKLRDCIQEDRHVS